MAYNGMEALAELTEEQRGMVARWLDEKRPHRWIVEELKKPAPEGCAVEVSPAAVGRFARRLKANRVAEELREKRDQAASILEAELRNQAEGKAVDFAKASISVLMGRVFDGVLDTRDPKAQRELLKLLSEMDARRERTDLMKANHDLAKEKFRFNAGRLVMKHWHELQEIHEKNPNEDDQVKIERARDLAFGLLPAPADSKQNNERVLTTDTESTEKLEEGVVPENKEGSIQQEETENGGGGD